ncbi:MAG: rhomboid family intramembrane serine protease [Clostridia bacterium]|nr:rhomboid family intramembrane serine protease [Clostridia bacterium]
MRRFTREVRYFLYKDFIPVTKGMIILGGVFFLLIHLYRPLYNLVVLTSLTFFRYPWTLLTYPLVNLDILSVLFSFLWLWFAGGSLERSWGTQTYGIFVFLVTLITGLAMALAGFFLRFPIQIAGFWLPLTAITWAWADVFRGEELLFWGIIPLKAEWLAWLHAALTFLRYFKLNWLLGLASVSGIAVVYLFRGNGPFSQGLRYWLWRRGFTFKGLTGRFRRKKRRLRVVE